MRESQLQIAAANFLDGLAYERKVFWFHVPNGGSRNKAEAAQLKYQGVKAGVPDCAVVIQSGVTAYIELKAKEGAVSSEQKDVHSRLQALHAPVYTIWASDQYDLIAQLREILRDMGVEV